MSSRSGPLSSPPGAVGPRVLAVTVNYRTPDLAIRALASLEAERAAGVDLEAVVVDNASGDGSAARILEAIETHAWARWARVDENPANVGFGAGNNRAIQAALAGARPPEHFLLLNPDASLDPGALQALLGFMASHPRAGMAGPATEVGRGNLRGSAFRFPGILNGLDEGLHLGPVTRLLGRWRLAPPPRAEAHVTDWLSGGCLLVRRELLEQVGLFDPRYFLYFEEVDLAWRAGRRGWESWFVPEARILHDAGAATGASAGRELERPMPAYWFESRRRFFLKNRGRLVCLLADLSWAAGNALWNLRRWLTRRASREPPGFWWDFVRFNLLGRTLTPAGAVVPGEVPGVGPGAGPQAAGASERSSGTEPGGLRLAVVVIARNEGERLQRCLDSLEAEGVPIVYVDSDSRDDSVARTRARGVEVLELDPARPLNAARGRNAGWRRVAELHAQVDAVFFIDGDCRLVPGFLEAARAELERDPRCAAACGRRREVAPQASFFNRVVDSEWDTPVGVAEAFGGDALVRLRALVESGGYREALNQGEDPELGFRLRSAGWSIRRIEHEMTLHDVALTRLAAWRRRHRRGGYAYAHGAFLQRARPGRYNQRTVLSILLWGAFLPLVVLLGLVPTQGLSLVLLGAYGVLWWRIRRARLARGDGTQHASRYAALIALGKIDEAVGVVRCFWDLLWRREALSVDYKEYQGGDQRSESERAA